jgi:hypothetical protein
VSVRRVTPRQSKRKTAKRPYRGTVVRRKKPPKPKPRKTKVIRRQLSKQQLRKLTKRPVVVTTKIGPVYKRKPHIDVIETTEYRKGGKRVKRGTPGAKRITVKQQYDRFKGTVREIERMTRETITKSASIDTSGEDMGRIDWMFFRTSASSAIIDKHVSILEISLSGRHEGKTHRFKFTMDLDAVRKRRLLAEAVIGRILEALRSQGFRTQYTVKLFREARQKGLKYPLTWQEWKELKVLTHVVLHVTMYRRDIHRID